jgi:hypothetical protein
VVADGGVEHGELVGGLAGEQVGQGEGGVEGLPADAFAVGLDPFVVAAIGQRAAVGADRAAQRRNARLVGVGGLRGP